MHFRKNFVAALRLSVGCLLTLASFVSVSYGGAPPGVAPEIDAGVIGSAVTLLAGGYFVLSSRARRK